MVILLPSRRRCTSLPSLTARRPKVDSAMSTWRQNSEIWLRIWSFFTAGLGRLGGQELTRTCPSIICPLGVIPSASSPRTRGPIGRNLAALAQWAMPSLQHDPVAMGPCLRRDDGPYRPLAAGHTSAFPPFRQRGFCTGISTLTKPKGAGNAGCTAAPAASCAKEKAHEL